MYERRQHDLKRAVLRNVLYEEAVEAGARVEFGKKMDSLDIVGGQVTFADESERKGDLVVGTDGERAYHDLTLRIEISANK
jgi:flavin-dependent dehydrogenase